MNATAFEGGKVHLLTETAARCGVGKHVRRGPWQIELGEVTCQRCRKIEERQAGLTTEAGRENHEGTPVGKSRPAFAGLRLGKKQKAESRRGNHE